MAAQQPHHKPLVISMEEEEEEVEDEMYDDEYEEERLRELMKDMDPTEAAMLAEQGMLSLMS